jgi:hypothetical protein
MPALNAEQPARAKGTGTKKLKDVPVKDVVLFPAGRAERAYSATKQQSRPDGDEDRGQVRLELGEPVSDDGKISN